MIDEDAFRQALGPRIKEARQAANMRQSDLSEKLGFHHPSSVAHWETARRTPTLYQAAHLAELTGVSVAWLLGGERE